MKVKIGVIQVGERARKEMGDLAQLALSMSRLGQIHPIVVNIEEEGGSELYSLVAGERRLRAAQLLGWTDIECVTRDKLSPIQQLELELEENIQRQNMTWQEEVAAKKAIDEVKRKLYGSKSQGQRTDLEDVPAVTGSSPSGWGITDTATAIGEGVATVSRDIQLAQAMETMPELAQEKTKSAAYKKLKQTQERLVREVRVRDNVDMKVIDEVLVLEDAREWLRSIPDATVDCIITDPPYGVNKSDGFDDSFKATMDLLHASFKEVRRICKPDAHIYVFFATKMYAEVRALLSQYFYVHPVPVIWEKSRGTLSDWDYYFTNNYETAFYCWPTQEPKRRLRRKTDSVIDVDDTPASERFHPTQKPIKLLREFISLSTVENELVVDPFAGSGSTLAAAISLGRKAGGCENNPEFYERARLVVAEAFAAGVIPEDRPNPVTKPAREVIEEEL